MTERKLFEDNKIFLWGLKQASKKLLDEFDTGNKNPFSLAHKKEEKEEPKKKTTKKEPKKEVKREFNLNEDYGIQDLEFLERESDRIDKIIDNEDYGDKTEDYYLDLQEKIYDLIEGIKAMKKVSGGKLVKGSKEAKEFGQRMKEAREAKRQQNAPKIEEEKKKKETEKQAKQEAKVAKRKPWYYLGDIPKGYREANEDEAIKANKVSEYGKYIVDKTKYDIYQKYKILPSTILTQTELNLNLSIAKRKALRALEDIEIYEAKMGTLKYGDKFKWKLEEAKEDYKLLNKVYNALLKLAFTRANKPFTKVVLKLPPKPEIKYTPSDLSKFQPLPRPIDPRTGKPAEDYIQAETSHPDSHLMFENDDKTITIDKKHFDIDKSKQSKEFKVKNFKTALKMLNKGVLLDTKHYKKEDLDKLVWKFKKMSGKGISDILGIKPFINVMTTPPISYLGVQVPTASEASKSTLTTISQSLPDSAIKSEIDYTKTVLHGRDDFPPKVRKVINEFGDKPISKLTIVRHPLANWTVEALNAISLGEFKKRYENEPYENLYHLGLKIDFKDGTSILIEKNEVINTVVNPKLESNDEIKPIKSFPSDLTLNIMLEGAREKLGDNLFKYNAGTNNCQSFVNSLIYKFSDTEEDRFVKQNTEQLFKGLPIFTKMVNATTDLGAKVNEITEGTGFLIKNPKVKPQVQSVLFKKPYPLATAKKWLHKHDFKFTDVDNKSEHIRFRQFPPNKKYDYRTHPITEKISLIIAY